MCIFQTKSNGNPLFVHQQKYNNRQRHKHTDRNSHSHRVHELTDIAEVHCLKNVRQSAIGFLYFPIYVFHFAKKNKIEVIPKTKTICVKSTNEKCEEKNHQLEQA